MSMASPTSGPPSQLGLEAGSSWNTAMAQTDLGAIALAQREARPRASRPSA